MDKDQHSVAFTCRSLRDVAETHRLAAAGRQYRQDAAVAELVLQAYISNELLLVRAEVHGWEGGGAYRGLNSVAAMTG